MLGIVLHGHGEKNFGLNVFVDMAFDHSTRLVIVRAVSPFMAPMKMRIKIQKS